MKDKDQIKELFSEKLGSFEAEVNPNLWQGVQSQVAAGAAAKSTSLGLVSKIAIVATVAAGTIAAVALLNNNESNDKPEVIMSKANNSESKEITNLEKEQKETVKNKANIGKKDDSEAEVNQERVENVDFETLTLPITPKESLVSEDQPHVNEQIREGVTPFKPETKVPRVLEIEKDEDFQEENESFTIETNVNIFSPNGDKKNDEFFITTSGELFDFSIVIMNSKTGAVVYRSQDPSFRWNGMDIRNQKVKSGPYLYIISAKDANGKAVLKNQNLEIIAD